MHRATRFASVRGVWFRGAAIRPVPEYAVLRGGVLERIERELAEAGEAAQRGLDRSFSRFERTQPHLAHRVAELLAKPLDETALALGYFLSIAVWLGFDRTFGERLGQVTYDGLCATEASIALEEELRADHAEEPIDLDDIVAREQPEVVAFVNEHVDAALDVSARLEAGVPAIEVDVDDVHDVYRTILVLTLALSHAVSPATGKHGAGGELLA